MTSLNRFLPNTKTMISVTRFTCIRKDGIFIITGMEEILSPCCHGDLFVHGTCRRKLKAAGGDKILRLRVMECAECGTTHRELPNGIVPRKRYSAEMLCAIFNGFMPENDDNGSIDSIVSSEKEEYASDRLMCDASVRERIIAWLSWFWEYAQSIAKTDSRQDAFTGSMCSQLSQYVRVIVNRREWKQHRFAVSTS